MISKLQSPARSCYQPRLYRLTRSLQMPAGSASHRTLAAVIFDVDGVLVDSPHERAWREALQGITDPARLTTEIYQAHVAGKPRLSGARAVLEQLGVPDAAQRTALYAERKQRR